MIEALGVRFIPPPTGGRFKGTRTVTALRFCLHGAGRTFADVIPLCRTNKRFTSRALHVVLLMPLVISLHHLLAVTLGNRQKSTSKDRDLDPIRSPWKIAISISISMIVTALDFITMKQGWKIAVKT